MKTSKLFTIDVEIAEKLKHSDNSSGLVNKLLKEYFEVRSEKQGIFEEKKAIFNDLKRKTKEIKRQMRIFTQFESLKLDHFCIRWIKGQRDEPSIWIIREYIRSRSLSIPSENFIKAWRLIQEHGNLFEEI